MDVFRGNVSSGNTRWFDQVPAGPINGVNTVFTTAVSFVGSGVRQQVLTYNGVRLAPGVGCDYDVSESVPLGGTDTITMAFAPKDGDVLKLDFDPDI